MSEQALTFEGIMDFMRESTRKSDREFRKLRRAIKNTADQMRESGAEFDRRMAETERLRQEGAAEYAREKKERDAAFDLRMEKIGSEVGKITGSIGRIVEHMLGGKILEKFHALGYNVDDYTRNHFFSVKKLGIRGEIDLMLHDGDVSILIEVKTTLDIADVRRFLETMRKYRIYTDARWKDTPRYVGAVAGAVVDDNAMQFAHENGLFVIVQSGEAVDILPTPEGFQAKHW